MPDWLFEPCENEGDARDRTGRPYPHAVRGQKPGGRVVHGYGHTEPQAHEDAVKHAKLFDAQETIGQRGEMTYPGMPNG